MTDTALLSRVCMERVVNIQVPRDPRTREIAFITDIPSVLVDRIDGDLWHGVISGLNSVFCENEAPSFASFVKTLLVVPLLLGKPRNIFGEVEKYINKANASLQRYGIHIVHPGKHQYIELEVEVYKDHR